MSRPAGAPRPSGSFLLRVVRDAEAHVRRADEKTLWEEHFAESGVQPGGEREGGGGEERARSQRAAEGGAGASRSGRAGGAGEATAAAGTRSESFPRPGHVTAAPSVPRGRGLGG